MKYIIIDKVQRVGKLFLTIKPQYKAIMQLLIFNKCFSFIRKEHKIFKYNSFLRAFVCEIILSWL